jgi:hypothetical protein
MLHTPLLLCLHLRLRCVSSLLRAAQAEPSPGVAGATVPPAPSAEHAAALATATAVLKEASAGALAELIAEDGISEEQRLAGVAAAREARMRQLLNAITVLASSSGVLWAAVARAGAKPSATMLAAHHQASMCGPSH